MKPRAANFDRLARIYRALEFVAFGRDLERARFCFLEQLTRAHSILILGEGDGRFLSRLVRLAPTATIHCVDASAAMLTRAAARLSADERIRVSFQHADARQATFAPASYDAVVTLFFLDCFNAAEAAGIVEKISAALRPQADWLFADFSLPPRGWARLRARVWLAVLYAFFRWETGLRTRDLPPAEALIRSHRFAAEHERSLQAGLLRCVLFRRAAPASSRPS